MFSFLKGIPKKAFNYALKINSKIALWLSYYLLGASISIEDFEKNCPSTHQFALLSWLSPKIRKQFDEVVKTEESECQKVQNEANKELDGNSKQIAYEHKRLLFNEKLTSRTETTGQMIKIKETIKKIPGELINIILSYNSAENQFKFAKSSTFYWKLYVFLANQHLTPFTVRKALNDATTT